MHSYYMSLILENIIIIIILLNSVVRSVAFLYCYYTFLNSINIFSPRQWTTIESRSGGCVFFPHSKDIRDYILLLLLSAVIQFLRRMTNRVSDLMTSWPPYHNIILPGYTRRHTDMFYRDFQYSECGYNVGRYYFRGIHLDISTRNITYKYYAHCSEVVNDIMQ